MYREGNTIHALVHNEYHDPVAQFCRPGVSNPSNPCWYNAITYAVSTDGGKTFSQPPAPDHVVAALPMPWVSPITLTTCAVILIASRNNAGNYKS